MNEKADKIVQGHCPRCGPDRNADSLGFADRHVDDEASGVWWFFEHRILTCRGCETVYFQTKEYCSENDAFSQNPFTGEIEQFREPTTTHWPPPRRRPSPHWLYDLEDFNLRRLTEDIYTALDNELAVLAAIAIRTVFDRSTGLLGIDPAITFLEKLSMLEKKGLIGKQDRDILEVLTEAGHAAAHRGWRPKTVELDTMMEIIEAFLHKCFILSESVQKLKASVPAKPKRQEKSGASAKPTKCS